VLETLREVGGTASLVLRMEGERKVVRPDLSPENLDSGLFQLERRSLTLGELEVRGGRPYLYGREADLPLLRSWMEACAAEMWRGEGLTQERARELAEVLLSHRERAEGRALRAVREVLGQEVVDQLLREGRVRVRSSNGEEYVITEEGEVYSAGGRRCCVQVEGEGRLPKYDRFLAVYLTVRDRPEKISTLRPHPEMVEELTRRARILMAELERLVERLHLGWEERVEIPPFLLGSGT
jgi:hypothetical protein